MSTYEDALIFAVKAHDGQTRWNGDPYITHPIRVARRVAEDLVGRFTQTYIDLAKTIAVLHDTVEDTDVTLTQIENQFGPDVRLAVQWLTRREGTSYSYFIGLLAASKNEVVLRVKIADISDNLSDLDENHGLRKRYERALTRLKKALVDRAYS